MGEVRALEHQPAGEDTFEPEITWTSATGTEYTMRLDFAVAREMSRQFKADVMASTFEWSQLKMQRWPELAKLLHDAHHGDLSTQDWEKILHPRNATLMVRAWGNLWRKFNAVSDDDLERLVVALRAMNFEDAPADVADKARAVLRWAWVALHPEDAEAIARMEAGEDDEDLQAGGTPLAPNEAPTG